MRFLAILLLTALAVSAQTNILKVSFADLGLEVRANRKIELRSVQTNLSAPYIISREYKSALTDTNGVCRFTNVVAGAYDLSLASTPPTIVRIGVTNSGTNVMEAYGLVNVASDGNAVQGYTQAAADARFYLRSNPSNYVTASITNGLGGGGGTTYTNANIRVGLISGSSIGTNTSLLLSTNEFYSASNNMVSAWTASDAVVSNAAALATSGSVLVGLWTYDDKGYYPTVGGDGSVFQQAYDYRLTYNTNYTLGNNSFVRLGSRDYLLATRWNTNLVGYPQYTYTEPGWALWKTANFLSVTNTAFIQTGISGLIRLWAPMLFQDTNGVLFCYFGGSTSSNGTFQIYQQRATDTTYTNWTAATVVTNLASNSIDPEMVWDGSRYVLFFKDETTKYICAATSSNPTNGFSVVKTGDWAGFGSNAEAPSVTRKPNGDWMIFFDRYIDGTWMNVSVSTNLLAGWSARSVVKCPNMTNIVRHGTARYVPASEVGELIFSAAISTNTQQHLSRVVVEGPWDGIGRNVVVGSGQAGFAIYPNGFSSSPWLLNGTTTFFTLWTPGGMGFQYNSSTKTFAFTGSLTASNFTTTGGTFTGNASGLTNLPASQLTGTVPNGRLTGVTISNATLVGSPSISVTNLTAVTTLRIGEGTGGGTLSASTGQINIDNNLQVNGGTGFTGKGGNLTELNASQLTTGTVPSGRLTTVGTNLVGAVLTSDGVGNRYWTNAVPSYFLTGAGAVTNNSTSTRAIAVGSTAAASANDAAAIGSGASATGTDSVSLRGSAGGTASASIGYLAKARGNYSFATMNATAGVTGSPSVATDIFCFGNGSVETNSRFARFGGNGGPDMTLTTSNGIFAGNIISTNGFVDVPRSSAPTFAQIGSRTNTPVMWWSNSAPCVRYVTYYDASSNAVTTNLFSLP